MQEMSVFSKIIFPDVLGKSNLLGLMLVVGGTFFNILTEFLLNRPWRAPDGESNEYRNAVFSVPQGNALHPLFFILYMYDMWLEPENMLESYMLMIPHFLFSCIPSPNVRSDVSESHNKDLGKIRAWCTL